MFLQALLLPNPIQRSFLQMQEDIVKGCKAKCVERANESKYQNSGPFFSQGENGPEDSARGVAAIAFCCRNSSCNSSCDAIARNGRRTIAFFLLFRVQSFI